MRQKKTTSWNYDSVVEHYALYRDSVAVDYDFSEMRYIYVHKDADYTVSKSSDYDSLSHEAQYYIVPGFIAIITAVMIFAFVLLRDNEQALKQKRKDSVLNMMSKK